MGIRLCPGSNALDLSDACVRASLGAIVPAALILALCLFSILRVPAFARPLASAIKSPFRSFLTLREAEALDNQGEKTGDVIVDNTVPLWRTVLLSFVALIQALLWSAAGAYNIITNKAYIWTGITQLLIAATWIYASCKSAFWPKPTIHYDLFTLFVLHFAFGIILLGGTLYDHEVLGVPLPPQLPFLGLIFNLIAILVVMTVVGNMPFELPSDRIKKEDIYVKHSPEDYASMWEWITFSWVYPLITRGSNMTMAEDDVWNLSPTQQSRPVFIKFSTVIRSSLLRRLWAANSKDLLWALCSLLLKMSLNAQIRLDFCLTYVSVIFTYASPFFLKRILDAIDEPTAGESVSSIYLRFVGLPVHIAKESDVQHLWFGRRAATRMRVELMAAIYDKALKRQDYSGIIDQDKAKEAADKKAGIKPVENPTADDPKAGADVGKIVNLMAVDANRIAMMVSGAYFIYGSPFEIIIATTFLYNLLGLSAFAGFIVLLAGWPLNSFVTKRSIRIQKGVSASRDKRMAVLNELISAVKFIKFFAWEDRWIKRTMEARGVEMNWMVKARINSVMFTVIWTSAPILVSLISFFTFVYQGNQLTVSVAFTSIALFSMIRQPLGVIPAWIVQILQTGVALKRIETYLEEDEVDDQVSSIKKARAPHVDGEDDTLSIENGTFKWNEVPEKPEETPKAKGKSFSRVSSSDESATAVDSEVASIRSSPEDHRFILKDISIRFPEGELSVITGPTASGKTALLVNGTVGRDDHHQRKLTISKNTSKIDENGFMHSISYAAQSPWLRHQSIKDNILFGQPFDEERYNDVVECCALRPDLNILEDGDDTEIGSRGVSLSGGQKARVALARAVYARTKYIMLDDPLSAVDSHTARFLYERLFRGPLMANRTVILVTHHVELVLPGTYYLVRMLDGCIDAKGTVKDLRAQGILDHIAHDSTAEVKEEPIAAIEIPVEAQEDNAEAETSADSKKKPRKLIKDEHREAGGVKWSIYNAYLKASSYRTWFMLGILIACSQSLGVIEKLWVRQWGQAYGDGAELGPHIMAPSVLTENEALMNGYVPYHDHRHYSNNYFHVNASGISPITLPDVHEHPLFYVGVYAMIGFATAALLTGVVCATMRWHDVTPAGRMLNRFGKDIETIDTNLAGSLSAVNSSLATFAAAIITVVVFFPIFLIPAVVIGFFYRLLALGYLKTGRDLRRMESNSRSPIFSGFSELLEGIVTVRAFSAEQRFLDDLHDKIDMWYNFWMTNRWLLLNFDGLGGLAVLTTTLLALSGYVSAGTAGLCITSAMTFTTSVYWACRFWTALELDLNSVERVVEYLDLPQEPAAVIESSRPPAYWPSSSTKEGLLTVEDLVIKYAPELPPVLHNVSFTLNARERIGLLGRTGSGKSTLAMSILRFVDPVSGRILIDGIDISTIGVHDLRSRLTFIPQDATLFSGTLRDNLDPFGEHEDSECLDVLYRVQMLSQSAHQSLHNSRAPSRASTPDNVAPSVTSMAVTDVSTESKITITLETQVSAGGTNFSQGQRQLIAMARALLRRSAIIVLDEATSSIDFDTDAKIQATIREEFTDSLLLTVAHRLRTVIDYDRLIVLDAGEVAEFDTPLNLIQKEDGIFRTMCLKSGTFAELEAAARPRPERDAANAKST
ncbi:uncharacterized protein BJ212DRAFT_1484598 [Suillus subaureus]|uniref:Multidrug resistance-associated ABC transporter n=1 Tax=Suillus subaureus TaxID=48587 RepID=A0A9P7J8N9_9AGAM|nr:uncharacterized protein BJ212DRAFT_1484598 [Suillus subaureus]KAG1809100.1 hypothetical protein BJ212DRAFT_1484598 [Suillus subaureus]